MPGLGLAPDLGERLVVAPYAAALALVVAAREACDLARLEQLGYLGPHGFYDAIDYTAELSRTGQSGAALRDRDGASQRHDTLGAAHALLGPTMPQRFLRHPHLRCTTSCCRNAVPEGLLDVNAPVKKGKGR